MSEVTSLEFYKVAKTNIRAKVNYYNFFKNRKRTIIIFFEK